MRRRPAPPPAMPEQLARLVPIEWADDLDTAVERWRAGRRAHLVEHRDAIDGVEFIKFTHDEIRRVRGLRPLGGGARRRS